MPTFILIASNFACSTTIAPEPDLSREKREGGVINLNNEQSSKSWLDASGNLHVEVNILGGTRSRDFIDNALISVSNLYAQCQIPLKTVVREFPNENATDVSVEERYKLTYQYAKKKPTVFIINSNAEQDVAFSYLPSIQRDVSGTAWISQRVSEECFAWIVAHEIGHIVLDSAAHHLRRNNVMHAQCSAKSNFNRGQLQLGWTEEQCAVMSARR